MYSGDWNGDVRSGFGCWHVRSEAAGFGGHCGLWGFDLPQGCGTRWNELESTTGSEVANVRPHCCAHPHAGARAHVGERRAWSLLRSGPPTRPRR